MITAMQCDGSESKCTEKSDSDPEERPKSMHGKGGLWLGSNVTRKHYRLWSSPHGLSRELLTAHRPLVLSPGPQIFQRSAAPIAVDCVNELLSVSGRTVEGNPDNDVAICGE